MTEWEKIVFEEAGKLAEESYTFTMIIRGALNAYEEGEIKDMMLDSWQKVYDQSIRVRVFMDMEK